MAYPRKCVHTEALWRSATDEEVIFLRRTKTFCDTCSVSGPNLWLCLHARCFYVGCGDAADDHSTQHYDETNHNLTVNLSSMKIWCYTCSLEVFRDLAMRPTMPRVHSATSNCCSPTTVKHMPKPEPPATRADDSDSDSAADDSQRPRGLTGLRNIGNTCYMNAALQALSNCPPMTQFFLDCPGYMPSDKNPGLAKSYMKLMVEIWDKNRASYVTPTSIFNSIRAVHPMFRGYLQHDSQEFLRCFMDHLHEELKQPVVVNDEEEDDANNSNEKLTMKFSRHCVTSAVDCDTSEPSDTDYETCDSGLSSESNSVAADVSPRSDDPDDSVGQQNNSEQSTVPVANLSASLNNDVDIAAESSCTATMCVNEEASSPPIVVGDSVSQDLCEGSACTADTQCRQKSEAGAGEVGTVLTAKPLVTVPLVCSDGTISDTTSLLSTTSDSKCAQESDASSQLTEPAAAPDTRLPLTRKSSLPREKQQTETADKPSTDKPARPLRVTDDTAQKLLRLKPPIQYVSIISAIFDGKILSSVQCMTCERISCTKETFQDLSLPIPGKEQLQYIRASSQQHATSASACDSPLLTAAGQRSPCADSGWRLTWLSSMFSWMFSWFWGPVIALQDCLAAFFSADDLKGDNMYSCEKCKKLRNGVKFSKVLQLPEILCIHLKRFRHEFMFSSKIGSYVSFPLEGLDMRPYLHKDCKDTVTSYDLIAVICHHGTAGGGHYTTYALNYVNLSWYEYDDQIVTEVDPQQVENCEAYVLFYRKRNEDMLPLRQRADQIFKRSEKSLMSFYVSRQWITKFNTFAEPGPITNYDFLCQHGELLPSAATGDIAQLIMEIPQNLWEFLHTRYGGGPAVNRLSACKPCVQEAERLSRRQQMEKQAFLELKAEFQEHYAAGAVYVLSMAWFRDWENFVCCKTDEPPGPIDNKRICQTKNGVLTVITNSDYAQISEDMWLLLRGIYSGGPELLLKPAATQSHTSVSRKTDEAADMKPEPVLDK